MILVNLKDNMIENISELIEYLDSININKGENRMNSNDYSILYYLESKDHTLKVDICIGENPPYVHVRGNDTYSVPLFKEVYKTLIPALIKHKHKK